jgi:HSP20 family protein
MMADLIRRNVYDELRGLADAFSRRLAAWSQPEAAAARSGSVVSGDTDCWRVDIALPGIAPENIDVQVVGRTIHVRAAERDGEMILRRYDELMTLPESVDTGRIAASYRHGLLELMLPVREEPTPRRIEIAREEPKQLSKAA